jgi:hypothetical protein
MGEWRYSSTILDLGTRQRSAVIFTPQPLYPRYPLDRRLGGAQAVTRRCSDWANPAPEENATPGIDLIPEAMIKIRGKTLGSQDS